VIMRRSLSVYCSRHTAIDSSGHPAGRCTFLWGACHSTRAIYCNSSADNRNRT
jgi:hypothetical protein